MPRNNAECLYCLSEAIGIHPVLIENLIGLCATR